MKKSCFLCVCTLFLFMSGCGIQSENPTEKQRPTTECDLTVDEYGYNPLTDAQSNLGVYSCYAYTDHGYYTYKDFEKREGDLLVEVYWLLMFYDNSLGEMYPVCSKADCTHDSESCDAYLANREYPRGGIWYQNGAVYLLKVESAYLTVEKIEKDGSARTKVCDLAKIQTSSTTNEDGKPLISTAYPEVQLHRGYAYFTDCTVGDMEVHLYRVKLDSSQKAETIDTISSESEAIVDIYAIKPFGKYVFYRMGEYDANSSSRVSFAIYAYDTDTGEKTLICDEIYGGSYTVWERALYYFGAEDEVYRVDLDTGEKTLFFEPDIDTNSNPIELFAADNQLVYEINWALYGSSDPDSDLVCYWKDENGERHGTTEQILLDKDGNIVDRLRNDKDELVTAY